MAKNRNFDSDTLFDDITRGRKDNRNDVHEVHNNSDVHEAREVRDASDVLNADKPHGLPEQTHNVDNVLDVHEAHNVQDGRRSMSERMLDTKGRKGEKMKRIHLSCPDDIYEYVTKESRKRGLGRTVFINAIIEAYMKSPDAYKDYFYA